MSNLGNSNRRRYPRAHFVCQLTVWRTDGSSEVLMTETTNIGAGGVGVRLDKILRIDTMVELRIEFTQPAIPLKCRAKIARCDPIVSSPLFEVGIEFAGLDEV